LPTRAILEGLLPRVPLRLDDERAEDASAAQGRRELW